MSELDQEAKEILAIVTSVQPIINAYHRGELTEPEVEYLRAVMQSLWPTVQTVITGIWAELEPIMTRLGLWPVEENEEYETCDGSIVCLICGMRYIRHSVEVKFSQTGEQLWLRRLCSGKLVKL